MFLGSGECYLRGLPAWYSFVCAWCLSVGGWRGSSPPPPIPRFPRGTICHSNTSVFINEWARRCTERRSGWAPWGCCTALALAPGDASPPRPDIFILRQWTFAGGCLHVWILQRRDVWNRKENGSVMEHSALCSRTGCNKPTQAAGS